MKIFWVFILILALYISVTRFTYFENQENPGAVPAYPCAKTEGNPQAYSCQTLEAIQQNYAAEIEPIFEQKCNMCHGFSKSLPLYTKLPPASWLVDHDREEALHEVNFTWGFPFHGKLADKGGQDLALEEIDEVIENKSMPPKIYLIMHWKSALNKEEKAKILAWTKQTRAQLEKQVQP